MATLVEEEAQYLADYFKKLIRGTTFSQTREYNSSNYSNNSSSTSSYNNNNNKKSKDGQIYQLIDEMEMEVEKNEKFKPMKLENVYAKAEDYEEIRRLSQPTSVVISMHDAFGVPVLNTLWRMMAGRR